MDLKLEAKDLFRKPDRARSAIQFLEAFKNIRVVTQIGEFPLRISQQTGLPMIDLRQLSASSQSTPVVLPSGPEGYVLFTDSTDPSGYRWVDLGTELTAWINAATADGGTFTDSSKAIAARLLRGIRESTYNSKLKYLMPFLGGNLATALIPLRDTLGVGAAVNYGFVDADFSETSGLQGNGTSKVLDSQIKPGDLGSGGNGGIGWWETNYAPGGTEGMISYLDMTSGTPSAQNYFYLGKNSGFREFAWNQNIDSPNHFATSTDTQSNGHFYGQRSSSTSRTLYKAGVQIASNTVSDSPGGLTLGSFYLMGANRVGNVTGYHNSCVAAAYMTDGTMTPTEIADLHSLLDGTLIGPLGR